MGGQQDSLLKKSKMTPLYLSIIQLYYQRLLIYMPTEKDGKLKKIKFFVSTYQARVVLFLLEPLDCV